MRPNTECAYTKNSTNTTSIHTIHTRHYYIYGTHLQGYLNLSFYFSTCPVNELSGQVSVE